MDNREAYNQATIVEIEGKVSNTSISILIDPGSYQSYVSPKIVDLCKLDKVKHEKPWMVQLATGRKQNFYELVKDRDVNLNSFLTIINLNIIALGSYDILISMD